MYYFQLLSLKILSDTFKLYINTLFFLLSSFRHTYDCTKFMQLTHFQMLAIWREQLYIVVDRYFYEQVFISLGQIPSSGTPEL